MINKIKELISISQYAGNRVDFTQGGGGNTSVKFGDNLMAIKASGFKLTDISEKSGFVAVDFELLKKYFSEVDVTDGKSHEEENTAMTKQSIREIEGLPTLRPSVEVGFHAMLKDYVIHTHSIYANLLCCSKTGVVDAKEIFKGKDFNYIFMPYITPGFELGLAIKNAVDSGTYPDVIFMQNHGLIVSADTAERAQYLHAVVNESIREYFDLKADELKNIVLTQIGENRFTSNTPIIKEFLASNKLTLEFLDELSLYPDQLVYLNNTLRHMVGKVEITDDAIIYNMSKSEAQTLEETLAAYLFVILKLNGMNKEITKMSAAEIHFINNWEAEKYRRSAIK